MSEEDFACENFSPQRWRKDMCRNCYQSQRLHVKKQIKSDSKTSSSSSSPMATSPQIPARPLVPSPTPPSSVASPTPPRLMSPTTPATSKPRGLVPSKPSPPARPGLPSKPSPPTKPKGSVSPPSKPKGSTSPKNEPKVFQRFRVNRDLGIDKSIPPRERTQLPESGCSGIVKKVHDQVKKAGPQSVASADSPSPPPPVIPPRPLGYEIPIETKSSSSTAQTPTEDSTTPAETNEPSVPSVPAEQLPPNSETPAETQPETQTNQPSASEPVEQPVVSSEIESTDETKSEAVVKEDTKEESDVLESVQQQSLSSGTTDPVPILTDPIPVPSDPGTEESQVEQTSIPEPQDTPVEDTSLSAGEQATDEQLPVTLESVQQQSLSSGTTDPVSIPTDPIPVPSDPGTEESQVEQTSIPEPQDTPVEDTSLSAGEQATDEQLPVTVEETMPTENVVSDTTDAVTTGREADADSWVMVEEVVEQQVCPVLESGINELGTSDETNKDEEPSQQQQQQQQQQQEEEEVQQQQEQEVQQQEEDGSETQQPMESENVNVSTTVDENTDETHDQIVPPSLPDIIEGGVVDEGVCDEPLATSQEERDQADQQPQQPEEAVDPDEVVKSKIVTVGDETQPIDDYIPSLEPNIVPPPPCVVPPPPPIVPPTPAIVLPATGATNVPPAPPPDMLNGVPLPPPPPPVVTPTASPKLPRARDVKAEFHSAKNETAASAHDDAMQAIKGGVKLKAAPPPKERAVGEEKIVDVASELRQKLLKRKKQETNTMASQLEVHYEELKKMKELLLNCRGTHSFLHQLQSLLSQVDTLIAKTNVPPEILAQRLQWPTYLVDDLREVIKHMKTLQMKVVAAENLCKRTMANSMQPTTGAGQTGSASVSNINPAAVEKCVQDVVMIAKELNTDESRYFRASQSFAVDESDMERLIQRAADAVCPLLDRVYDKAFYAHSSIYEPSVTKFDQGFRVQNARRLLRLATKMSDLLALHLQVPKHACYSEAALKCTELPSDFNSTIKVIDREGEWDTEEQLQLGSVESRSSKSMKEDSQLVQSVLECLSSESGFLTTELETQVTPAVLTRIELQLMKATMATGNLQTVTHLMCLTKRVYSGDIHAIHKHDFNWLLEAVTKGNVECLEHLVKSCEVYINCQVSGGATILHRAVQRQHLPTVALLIRLGADPLIKNTFDSSPVQGLALKCFPPAKLTDKTIEREPLFDLSSYINNPSLSDVILISSDNKRFNGHRIILCAQSPVMKAMMDSDIWAESNNKEIPLPTISGKVVQFLLKYLYTGECMFPRDDLNLAIELMAAADQFLLELMKQQCERVLCEKIDLEVAVPLYHAAFQFSAPKLLANTQHFILTHYHELEDPNHELLLHILDNAVSGKQQL